MKIKNYFLPDLPAFLIIRSPAYLIPFPLYGSGGRISRIFAASFPTSSLSIPDTNTLVLLSTLKEIPSGGITSTG